MTATARPGVDVPFEIMNTICPESDPYFDLSSDPADCALDRDGRLRQESNDEDDDEEEDDEKDKDDDDEDDRNNRNDGYSE
jgi:hypothetical protein